MSSIPLWIYIYNFFIPESILVYLDSFQIQVIVSSATMNAETQMSFLNRALGLWGNCQEEMLNHVEDQFLIFKKCIQVVFKKGRSS